MYIFHWAFQMMFDIDVFSTLRDSSDIHSEPLPGVLLENCEYQSHHLSMPEKISLKIILCYHSLLRAGSATQPLSDKCIRHVQFIEFIANKISKY